MSERKRSFTFSKLKELDKSLLGTPRFSANFDNVNSVLPVESSPKRISLGAQSAGKVPNSFSFQNSFEIESKFENKNIASTSNSKRFSLDIQNVPDVSAGQLKRVSEPFKFRKVSELNKNLLGNSSFSSNLDIENLSSSSFSNPKRVSLSTQIGPSLNTNVQKRFANVGHVTNDFSTPKSFKLDAEFECKNVSSNPRQVSLGAQSGPSPSANGADDDEVRFRTLLGEDNSAEFMSRSYKHSAEMERLFHDVFGLNNFRHKQLPAVNASLLGHDCFILMPTGAGKSLCYQLPAIMSPGITVVVSPLRSLIEDQVTKLKKWNIEADALTSETTPQENERIFMQLHFQRPDLKLLYVTPEKITQSTKLMQAFESLYNRNMLSRFVIDEAHCVSQWGHDFRPDYKRLSMLKVKFTRTPVLALTATATPKTVMDTQKQLGITNGKLFVSSFCRHNLSYSIKKKSKSGIEDMIELIKKDFNKQSGILYCLSRKECEDIASTLNTRGIFAQPYHAGLTDKKRKTTQRDWISGKVKIICATIAFGMGIDKPNVRFVIHYSMAKSIEGYYQETGRAGRDGLPAKCILLYTYKDSIRLRRLMEMEKPDDKVLQMHQESLLEMLKYCESVKICRRKFLVEYFGEIYDSEKCIRDRKTACDVCLDKTQYQLVDISEDVHLIIKCVQEWNKRNKEVTLSYVADVYRGANTAKINAAKDNNSALYGRGSCFSNDESSRIMRHLIVEKILHEMIRSNFADHTLAYVHVGSSASSVLAGNRKVLIHMCNKKSSRKDPVCEITAAIDNNKVNSDVSDECFNALNALLILIEEEEGLNTCSTDVILSAEGLQQIACWLPRTESDLLKVDTMTETKMRKYGSRIMSVLQPYWDIVDKRDAEKIKNEVNSLNVGGFNNAYTSQSSSSSSSTRTRKNGSQRKRFGGKKFQRKKYKFGKRNQSTSASGVTKNSNGTFTGPAPTVHFR